jgi:actin-related protein
MTGDTAIIIDGGSGQMKVGLTTPYVADFQSQTIFPSIIGVPKTRASGPVKSKKLEIRDCVLGPRVTVLSEFLEIIRPIERGVVTDWEVLCRFIQHLLEDLYFEDSISASEFASLLEKGVKQRIYG